MNVLLLTPQPPLPAHQGSAIRNWGILEHLARRHAVTLLSFGAPGAAPPPELAAACHAIVLVPLPRRGLLGRLRTAASGEPDLAERLWSPEFDRKLRRLLGGATRFDLAQVEGLELGRYIGTLRAVQPSLPILYDAHNAEVTIQERAWQSDRQAPGRWPAAAYSRLQVGRLARFEAAVCREASAVTCVSAVDAQALGRLLPGLQPIVISNGIALADYPLPEAEPAGDEIITFSGKMDYRPNVDAADWFASEIWPKVRLQHPSARFEVVGQGPPPSLARISGISVVGAVPDIRPYIAHSAVYVAPLRMGGGTRFKLLQAMALGRPVVSTTIGAEGFAVQSGRELLVADTADDFAQAVLHVLANRAQARALGEAARAFVVAGYDWSSILARLDAVHERLVGSYRASG